MASLSIRVEPETGVAIATCDGALSQAEARELVATLWKTPDWPGRAAVWDFREAQFSISSSEVRESVEFIRRNEPQPAPARVAFVTGRDADFGMARMFQAFRENSVTRFQVFRDLDEAVAWARRVSGSRPAHGDSS